jgi:hypothetical protein
MRIDNDEIREWVLNDERLYNWALAFSGGNGDAMDAALPKFIRQHRAELVSYIRAQLKG